jgi:hypothetical protein
LVLRSAISVLQGGTEVPLFHACKWSETDSDKEGSLSGGVIYAKSVLFVR